MDLLLPVGHSLGATTDPETGAPAHRVRVGPDVVRLSEPQFAVWALVHGVPDRDAVLSAAADLPDVDSVLKALVDDGLVAEVTPGTPTALSFAESYQLKPLMLGLGNRADDPETYEVGLPGQPVAQIGAVLFRLYQWGHLESDLWAACRATSVIADVEPGPLLDAVLEALPALLGPNAAYLDAA
ncbi:hypothetical protein [Cryptosporangium sp. NPDC048952]|uniref:hypothetical protein n=1 Tax=Cryptosporangium sp. NPDC048952 TaxID=3363961 RepID=UPI00371DA315